MGNVVYEELVPENPNRISVTKQFGIPISPTKALRELKPGMSFLVDNKRSRNSVVAAAYRLDILIRTMKEGSKYRIWAL